MFRTGIAVWTGDVHEGKGTLTTDSGVLAETPYSLGSRIKDDPGTSPEELLATAHAGCFNMALAHILGQAGHPPESLETSATLAFEMTPEGIRITRVMLGLEARVPGVDRLKFMELASKASKNCTISAVIKAKVEVQFNLTG